jgi:hypothetical protein
MWIPYNANPISNRVDDCAIRAVSLALDISWDEAFDLIAHNAKQMGNMMHNNAAFGSVLRQHGFNRAVIPNYCPDCYTAADFCRDYPEGVYVLGFGSHVATVIDGNIYDTWDSSKEIPIYYWYEAKEEY